MANDNIYDIILSEEVAREDAGGSGGGSSTELRIQMNTSSLIALSVPIPNPIIVTSDISGIPDLWEIVPDSHTIYFDLGGGFVAQPGAGSLEQQINNDSNNGTSSAVPGTIERRYFSEIKIREIAVPTNEATYTSEILLITTIESIFYGFLSTVPSDPADLSGSVLSNVDVLAVASNNAFEDFYIVFPNTLHPPLAIADEHGIISNITDYPIQVGAMPNFITYKFKWPIIFTGEYLHKFTLIYS